MKEKFLSKWSNWWILTNNAKQLNEAFGKELNELIENEVALHQLHNSCSVCPCNQLPDGQIAISSKALQKPYGDFEQTDR